MTVTPVGRSGIIFAGLSFNDKTFEEVEVELEDDVVVVVVKVVRLDDGADIEEVFSDGVVRGGATDCLSSPTCPPPTRPKPGCP